MMDDGRACFFKCRSKPRPTLHVYLGLLRDTMTPKSKPFACRRGELRHPGIALIAPLQASDIVQEPPIVMTVDGSISKAQKSPAHHRSHYLTCQRGHQTVFGKEAGCSRS